MFVVTWNAYRLCVLRFCFCRVQHEVDSSQMRRWTDSTGRAASLRKFQTHGDPEHRAPHFTESAFREL